jgi:hypothetical protein
VCLFSKEAELVKVGRWMVVLAVGVIDFLCPDPWMVANSQKKEETMISLGI